MSVQLRWVGESDLDRVAQTRLRCYAKSEADLETYQSRMRTDPRSKPGDFLLVEENGDAVGTSTHIAYTMWVRGAAIPCQGVAWVGTIKTMRRKGVKGTPGIASAVMKETIRFARDRGDVVSALMPFRASYYEHFGYGIVERRADWTAPLAALPVGSFDGIRFYQTADFQARMECLNRVNQSGQCAIERSEAFWKSISTGPVDGFAVVDRLGDGSVVSSMIMHHLQVDGKDIVQVNDQFYQDTAALRRQLHFLSSLKDQFSAVHLSLPVDLPLNRLLTESQIPHRPVNHPVSKLHCYTRMQLRVLDHVKFLDSLTISPAISGSVTVAVHESEGHVSRFKVDFSAGRIRCVPGTSAAAFECPDRIWAGIATGDLKASDAIRFGLASGEGAILLDALAQGPVPFTHERF